MQEKDRARADVLVQRALRDDPPGAGGVLDTYLSASAEADMQPAGGWPRELKDQTTGGPRWYGSAAGPAP